MSECARRFESFVAVISSLFKVHGLDLGSHARSYISSLLSRVPRKNMERFAEEFRGIDYQNLQQFISDSPWECGPVWKWIADKAGALLTGPGPRMLLIDESSFAKKGDSSAGVARQYCGRLGKTESCQVGVYSALCRDGQALLTGARLYLPREWTEDDERCDKAGIPEEDRIFATKNALAWELIQEAEANGLKFDWIAADSAYGRDQELMLKIAGMCKTFVMDVETTHVELATRQGQRHFVERVFEDAKSELGMGEYQVRKWRAWHHHMALVGMAMAFAFGKRLRLEPGNPLISTRDVVDMVAWYFQEERSAADVEASIKVRHRRRKLAMECKIRRENADQESITM